MKNNIDLSNVFEGFGLFVRRFHTILFFLIVSGGLFVAILMLLSIISISSSSTGTSDQAIDGVFDEETIQRLERSTTEQVGPGSRPSPFVE